MLSVSDATCEMDFEEGCHLPSIGILEELIAVGAVVLATALLLVAAGFAGELFVFGATAVEGFDGELAPDEGCAVATGFKGCSAGELGVAGGLPPWPQPASIAANEAVAKQIRKRIILPIPRPSAAASHPTRATSPSQAR